MIDKVYVVTAGQYSDYHIERVFADKSKAEEFCKWIDKWSEGRVEEYQFSDDVPYQPLYTIRIELTWGGKTKEKLDADVDTDIDFRSNYQHYTYYDFSDKHELIVSRSYEDVENFDETTYTDKLVEYAYNLQALVKSLIADGYDQDMIRATIYEQSKNKVNNND